MATRFGILLLLLALALAAVANSKPMTYDASIGILSTGGDGGLSALHADAKIGDLIDDDEEMMMESESVRRALARRRRYISYDAMKRNNVPCNRRGSSYYACGQHQRVNPYTRGCARMSRCARNTR